MATAAGEGRVNLSPKGGPSLAVLAPKKLLWLNLTGSGNETALILRVYGTARAIYPEDSEWAACTRQIPAPLGARQYYSVEVELVQTSCGYAVPFFDYREDRSALTKWAEKTGEAGLRDYWSQNNAVSLDGLATRRGGPGRESD